MKEITIMEEYLLMNRECFSIEIYYNAVFSSLCSKKEVFDLCLGSDGICRKNTYKFWIME